MQDGVMPYVLAGMDGAERMRYYLALQCAPFLKGMRAACMVSIQRQDWEWFVDAICGGGAVYRMLGVDRGRCLTLFYRRELLFDYLKREDVREMLADMKYEESYPDGLVGELARRIDGYRKRGRDFPHETGLFLGYPVGDVKGFIRCGGQHCLFNGYWKVYENPFQAQMTFLAYDKAKVSVANELLSGKMLLETVNL